MALSEKEARQLEKLKQKEAEAITELDLEKMDENIEALFQYQDAFAALMIWNRFCAQLTTLSKDNAVLIREVRRLRKEAETTPTNKAE